MRHHISVLWFVRLPMRTYNTSYSPYSVVGDPGIGKSQLLRAAASVAPRAVYVCGNTTSAAGLTVSTSRDQSGFALEAGALVLADQVGNYFASPSLAVLAKAPARD